MYVAVLCLLGLLVPCVHSVALYHSRDHPDRIEHEYVVVIKTTSDRVQDWLGNHQDFDWATFQARLRDKYGLEVSVALEIGDFKAISIKTNQSIEPLLEDHDIDFIEPNIRFSLDGAESGKVRVKEAPQDGLNITVTCNRQDTALDIWGLSRINQRDKLKSFGVFTQAGEYSWSDVDDGSGVDVYVMDTGIYTDHVDILGRARHGFTSSSIADKEDNQDYKGHGTHVAGKIGGTIYGVAKNAQLIAVKVLDSTGAGSTVDMIEGLQYIYTEYKATSKSGKIVVNLSLGAPGSAPTMERAVMECVRQGIHLVVAAGNEYDDACLYTPGRVADVITVGSTSRADELSSFSNYGPCVDVLAPGTNIVSTWIGGPTNTAVASGTSMACPHVAGVVARYLSQPWEKYGSMPSTSQVKEYITSSATTGVVNLRVGRRAAEAASGTPNKLLYAGCNTAAGAYGAAGNPATGTAVSMTVILMAYVILI